MPVEFEGEGFVTDAGDYGFGFYVSQEFPKWEPPYDGVALSQSDRDRIINNIKQAMAFKNDPI